MPNYEIIYKPNSVSERSALQSRVYAATYRQSTKFITFYTESKQVLTVGAADVLQVKEVEPVTFERDDLQTWERLELGQLVRERFGGSEAVQLAGDKQGLIKHVLRAAKPKQ